jgi:acyl-CoA synthetase (AMP-forming)/AMP-acid ligase II
MSAPPGPENASVVDLLARGARDWPARAAVVVDGRTWSYADLWDGARLAGHGLQRAGVRAGDAVVLALPNGAEFFLAFFGTLIAGGVAVPVFPRSTPERLDALANMSGAAMSGAAALVMPVSPQADIMTALAKLSARGGRALLTMADLAAAGSPAPAPDDPRRPCYIQYTSGSTTDPRGVVITHRNVVANIGQMIKAMDITPDDIFVSWLPTYHDMGLTLMALTPFSLGTRLVLLPTDLRQVERWLTAIQEHRGTFTAGPDFAYRLCLRGIRRPDAFDLSSLKVCMNASEPVRAATLDRFQAAFGLRDVMMTGYGLAEATLSVTCTRRGQPIDRDERGLVCLGEPMPGTTVKIAADGEIVVSGPGTCAGYLGNPAASAALGWGDGFIRTGDLGYLDDAGRLYFVARRKDVIKLAGRTIYPQEVESLVDELAGVRLSAALGIDRGGVGGEQLYVFAEVRDPEPASAADLQALTVEIARAVHGALGVRPRRTLLLRPRRIPLTTNGKLRRAALRDAYAGGELVQGADIVFPPPVS